jgi:hypothetical protein
MHFFSSLSRPVIQFFVLLMAIFAFMLGASSAASTCTHYASPTGTGNGTSASQPFKIANFWAVAGPGKTLCLADGTYTNTSSMVTPPSGLAGNSVAPITIRALNDGAALIDGENLRNPVLLKNNDWFIIEGINAKRSPGTVVLLSDFADNNIIRRVCAWDTQLTANNHVFQTDNGSNNLFEDVCGFGIGRKIFEIYRGNNNTYRRAWGQWSQSTVIGPKLTFSIGYLSSNATCENCIGTWDETAMGSTPIDQPTSVLGMGTQHDVCTNNKYFGSVAYIRNVDKADKLSGIAREANSDADCFTYKDVALYVHPGTHTNLTMFQALNDTVGGKDKFLDRVTEIGGGTSSIASQWQVTNRIDTNSVPTGVDNIWNGSSSNGARLCNRYQNRVLTAQPLWPWPMDQRIRAALTLAGKNPDAIFGGTGKTLTDLMESIFGTIPSSCKTSTSPVVVSPAPSPSPTPTPTPAPTPVVTIPPSPTNLLVSP